MGFFQNFINLRLRPIIIESPLLVDNHHLFILGGTVTFPKCIEVISNIEDRVNMVLVWCFSSNGSDPQSLTDLQSTLTVYVLWIVVVLTDWSPLWTCSNQSPLPSYLNGDIRHRFGALWIVFIFATCIRPCADSTVTWRNFWISTCILCLGPMSLKLLRTPCYKICCSSIALRISKKYITWLKSLVETRGKPTYNRTEDWQGGFRFTMSINFQVLP